MRYLFIIVASAFMLASCSEERKINKKLEGTWVATSYNGEAVVSPYYYEITFKPDGKDAGSGSYTMSILFVSGTENFTYKLNENKMSYTDKSTGNTYTLTIEEYTDESLIWTDVDGKKTVLKPKS
jgi:hypothetical protein